MQRWGDRRVRMRFEVVGTLWGQLELTERARIVNISATGALIESPLAMALGSTQAVRVSVGDDQVLVEARVRHLRAIDPEAPHPRYVVGVEFVAPPVPLIHSIEQIAAADSDPTI